MSSSVFDQHVQELLLDLVDLDDLQCLRGMLEDRLFAAAGSLRHEDFHRLKNAAPDVIAVRSAACKSANRNSVVNLRCVQLCRETIDGVSWNSDAGVAEAK